MATVVILYEKAEQAKEFGLFRSTATSGARQIGDPPKDSLVPLSGLDDLGFSFQEKLFISG